MCTLQGRVLHTLPSYCHPRLLFLKKDEGTHNKYCLLFCLDNLSKFVERIEQTYLGPYSGLQEGVTKFHSWSMKKVQIK